MFCFLQVDDLQEEKNRIRQLFGERGFEGGHLLLPPNDGGGQKQLGHLKKTAARSERTQSHLQRKTRPRLIDSFGPAGGQGLLHRQGGNTTGVEVWRTLASKETPGGDVRAGKKSQKLMFI